MAELQRPEPTEGAVLVPVESPEPVAVPEPQPQGDTKGES